MADWIDYSQFPASTNRSNDFSLAGLSVLLKEVIRWVIPNVDRDDTNLILFQSVHIIITIRSLRKILTPQRRRQYG